MLRQAPRTFAKASIPKIRAVGAAKVKILPLIRVLQEGLWLDLERVAAYGSRRQRRWWFHLASWLRDNLPKDPNNLPFRGHKLEAEHAW